MRGWSFLFLFLFYHFAVFSSTGEQARVLVHTLNYISHDYQYAVKNGNVISKDEYKEAQEFGKSAIKYHRQFSGDWSDIDSAETGILIHRLDSLIGKLASPEAVSALANEAKQKVILASDLQIVPIKYPSLETGKVIYKTECARCHGATGAGDGPEGLALNPLPRNFLDDERMKTISPFTAFNTVRLGIEGTGMKPITTLDDEEVWDVAFYIAALRFQPLAANALVKENLERNYTAEISLKDIALTSDEEFEQMCNGCDSLEKKINLASIRLYQRPHDQSEFINTSLRYLSGAMELYKQGKYSEASQMAALSYLEGIEPVERQLKASDPEMIATLEKQMLHLRKMLEEKHPLAEVNDSLQAVRVTINSAGEILGNRSYSFTVAFLLSASVLLREGLEAFLVIMVILSILKAAGFKKGERWVHLGWMGAALVGVALWMAGGSLLKNQMQRIEFIEGVISFIAVAMLLYVGFWLHGKSEINRWKNYVNKMMRGVLSSESVIGLAALSFFVVFREVFESVLFLSALNIESGGEQTNAIVLGVGSAFVVVLGLAYLFLRFTTKLPIPTLFKISSFVMGLLAIILAGKGIHSFQELGLVSIHGIPVPRIELLGIFPTAETCAVQLAVFIIVAIIWKLTSSAKK